MTTKARILVISLRHLGRPPLGYGGMFEFEDSIQRFDDADCVDVVSDQTGWRVSIPHRVNTAIRVLSGGRFGNSGPVPWPADARLERDYDLGFFLVDGVFHMRLANLVRDVRRRCRTLALFVQESWFADYEDRRIKTQPYRLFDHYFFLLNARLAQFAERAGRPVHELAVACDTRLFASSRTWADRKIDVAWVGRRDPAMHERVLALCERRNWRYYYDPTDSTSGSDLAGQRRWLSAMLGDTRFAISNFARINQPDVHRGARMIASRFAEGAAAGNVLVGNLPDADLMKSFMPWPDSALECEGRPDDVIERLCQDPARMQAASRRNTANALRRHDWAHRWAAVLDTVGMARGGKLTACLDALEARARDFDSEPGADTPR